MQIIIDTRQDNPEEIRKIIKMLQALVGESSTDVFSATEQPQGLFNMFSQPEEQPKEKEETVSIIEY